MMIEGSRKLPVHHVTIRVPWHDRGWDGTVCDHPRANTECLILKRIAEGKRDEEEVAVAGRRLSVLAGPARPPCVDEHGTFMDAEGMTLTKRHPYATIYPESYGAFDETPLEILPWSAAAVPFRWMLRAEVEGEGRAVGKAARMQLGYSAEREEAIIRRVHAQDGRDLNSSFIQDFHNQRVMLDTFFGALEPETSLCFFYAKRTPLADDRRRVIVGVGRVRRVASPTEYRYRASNPPARGTLWERGVVHSIRPDLADGFVLPYAELLRRAEGDADIDLAGLVAFAPDEIRDEFSYGSELLPHDGAVSALASVAASLQRIRALLGDRWDPCIAWVDRELNRLWKARGAYPGLGSALTAFGLAEHGTLLAYEVVSQQARDGLESRENPWSRVDRLLRDPSLLPEGLRRVVGAAMGEVWSTLPAGRRALLELLSRFSLSATQATRWYQPDLRRAAGVPLEDSAVLGNPYLLYELDRTRPDPIAFAVIDRGMWPADDVRHAFPVPVPSSLGDAIDARRVRALTVDVLERASRDGHTLLPSDRLLERVRETPLSPACPLSEDILGALADRLGPAVATSSLADGSPAYQLDRYRAAQSVIATPLKTRVTGVRARAEHPWRSLIDGAFAEPVTDSTEERARTEKAAALEEIFRARVSVLIGPAGTGKTTLLKILCSLPEVQQGGLRLLAPTGKARVRLEDAAERRGEGMTLAQFLRRHQRYDGDTGRYYVNPSAPKAGGARTVIVDECSMLTEDQVAGLLDALSGVDRLILVGDPRQLPPIGAGRPFVDLVRHLLPGDLESRFPRVARSYAELTVVRRQQGERDDVAFARLFGGVGTEPGADALWDRVARGEAAGVRTVSWRDERELKERLFDEVQRFISAQGFVGDEEDAFAQSLGGSLFEGHVYFHPARHGRPGAASRVESWQILSPLRAGGVGVDALNREVQQRYRRRTIDLAREPKSRRRLIPKPAGPQGIVWGDKVINRANSERRKTYPKQENAYVANGDVGVVVGDFRGQDQKFEPKNLEVELANLPGVRFTYWASEFSGDEGDPDLELAYALSVHQTQGSQFGITFVVLPAGGRALSREMLYTALTRHQEELVVLHQGPLQDLWRFTDAYYSDVATRVTNLFTPSSPREVRPPRPRHGQAPVRGVTTSRPRYLEAGLVHCTERGELVRSKSELLITTMLSARGVDYVYEEPLALGGRPCLPDFTISRDDRGLTFYWEHLGMLDDPRYAARWDAKLARYRDAGFLPWDEGGSVQGTLLLTRDQPGGALDAREVARLIDEVILGDWLPT